MTTVVTPAGTRRRGAARPPARRARRLLREPERLDVLPAALRARAAERARVAALLEEPVAGRDRVEAGAALDDVLLDVGAVGGDEQLALATGRAPTPGGRPSRPGCASASLGAQAELDLLGERDRRTDRAPPASGTCPSPRSTGASARPFAAGGRAREARSAGGRVAGAVRVEPAGRTRSPRRRRRARGRRCPRSRRRSASRRGRSSCDRLRCGRTTARASAYSAPAAERRLDRLLTELPHPG